MDDPRTYLCKKCGKEYKHRQNLYRHLKLKHQDKNITFSSISKPKVNHYEAKSKPYMNQLYPCKYCDSMYKHKQSRCKHEKKCKYNTDHKYISKEEYDILLKTELHKLESEITEKLTKQFTKMLNEKQGNTNNIGNQLNDNAIQNNYIIQLGKEDVLGTLTEKEKLNILNERYKSVLALVKLMHCSGKYPQFNNSIISNLKSEFALTYSDKDEKFVTLKKNDLVSNIVSHRTANVEEMLDENKEKLTTQTNKKVTELIQIIETDGITLLEEETDFMKDYKTKIMTNIYDNRDEIKKAVKDLK
jgi:hypothetical protein